MNKFFEWFMTGGRKLPGGCKGLPSDDVNHIVDRVEVYKDSPSIVVVTQRDWSPEGISSDLSYIQLTVRGSNAPLIIEPGELCEILAAEKFDIRSGGFLPSVYAYPTSFLSNRRVHVELSFRSMGSYWLMIKNNGELPITLHGGDPVAWLMFGDNPIDVWYK